jgi:hypothetical protein
MGVGTDSCSAKERGQAVDRDNEDIVLEALDAPHADEAQDGECPGAGPSSPAP